MLEELASRGVSGAVEEHVFDRLEDGKGRRDRVRGAGGVSAG